MVAAILERDHSPTLRADLPLLFPGKVSQLFIPGLGCILHICPVLSTRLVCMPGGVALQTEPSVASHAFHELARPRFVRRFFHEGRAVLERAVDLLRGGDSSFCLSGGEDVEAGLRQELPALHDVEVVTTAVMRALDLRASGRDLHLRMALTTFGAILVVTTCQTYIEAYIILFGKRKKRLKPYRRYTKGIISRN